LVNALLAHCGESLSGIGGVRRPGIVHRLDKDTSGVMVVAKSEVAHAALTADFAARRITRAYEAVVWGVPAEARGEIDAAIGRSPRNRKKMAIVSRGGRAALTRYQLLRNYSGAAALLSCRLATGRTHQIRVHLSARGHPLIGDRTYGAQRPATRLAAAARARLEAFPRQALHAKLIGFRHPRSGEMLQFETALPRDMEELVVFLDSL
jgi:23S rRNA pseudouridine1911/1915/1917 synthase